MTKKTLGFGLMLVALMAVFSSMIIYQEVILNSGQKVVLKTVPVDPRDLFRGEYVILGYEIEAEIEEKLKNDVYVDGSGKVYAELDNSQVPATVTNVTAERPDSGLFITGEVSYGWNGNQNVTFPSLAQYYVPEGRGRPLERLRDGQLMVEVAVSKNGRARIVNLLDAEGELLDVSVLD